MKTKKCICYFIFIDDNSYEMTEVLLGNYHVVVMRDDWCWESNQHEIEVSTADVSVPVLKHVGFAVNLQSTHDATVSSFFVTPVPNQEILPDKQK